MKIICSCGKELTDHEDGVNETDYYECECGLAYNVLTSRWKKEAEENEEEESDEDNLKEFEVKANETTEKTITFRVKGENKTQAIEKLQEGDEESSHEEVDAEITEVSEEEEEFVDGEDNCILCGEKFIIGEDGNELGFCCKCQEKDDFPYDLDAYYKDKDAGKVGFKGFETMSRGILEPYRK